MLMDSKNKTGRIVRIGAVAALYVALTLSIAPLSFGALQFRISEVLMLLCFFKKDYIAALTLGCGIANLFSPMMALDLPFGTLATFLAAVCMWKSRNIWMASLFPVLLNGLIIGLELMIAFNEPFLLAGLSVAAGELAVVTVVGVPLFLLLRQNSFLMGWIGNDKAALQ